ncbi:MAG: hypothetical protein KF690_03080 [Bacteroidetes bacterium]|nr:hypothetical protein [Bacteroidota bacterium]
MKDIELKKRLHAAVESIEAGSGIELVVVVVPHSGRYHTPQIGGGLLAGALALGVFLFSALEFTLPLIFLGTLLAFLLGGMVVGVLPFLKRRMISRQLRQRYTDRFAGSVFWENRLFATREHVGLLLFFSCFEHTVSVVADHGVVEHLPQEELERLRQECRALFARRPFDTQLLALLESWKPVFARYLPPRVPNFNELPDSIHVEV